MGRILDFVPAVFSQYGLFGLFLGSFLSSTIFLPLPAEPLIATAALYFDLYLVVFVATIGSTLGTCVNYGIGFLGEKAVEKRIGKEKILKAQNFMNRYGWPGLLFIIAIPIPGLPVDPITIIPGLAKMRFKEFLVVVFAGKLIKYALFVGLFSEIMHVLM